MFTLNEYSTMLMLYNAQHEQLLVAGSYQQRAAVAAANCLWRKDGSAVIGWDGWEAKRPLASDGLCTYSMPYALSCTSLLL